MPILPFRGKTPQIAASAFIAPDAWVTGDTSIAQDVSVFFGVCMRGDINPIIVGEGSNIQEQAVLHTSRGLGPCVVGPRVTVGHGAILHGCEIKGFVIIGMGATVLDNAVVGEYCIIGANSLVTMGTKIPDRTLALGSPARSVRPLTAEEIQQIEDSAARYIEVGREYAKQLSVA